MHTDPNKTGLSAVLLNVLDGVFLGVKLTDDDRGEAETHAGNHGGEAGYHGVHDHHSPAVRLHRSWPDALGEAIVGIAVIEPIIGGVAFSGKEGVRGGGGSVCYSAHGISGRD